MKKIKQTRKIYEIEFIIIIVRLLRKQFLALNISGPLIPTNKQTNNGLTVMKEGIPTKAPILVQTNKQTNKQTVAQFLFRSITAENFIPEEERGWQQK